MTQTTEQPRTRTGSKADTKARSAFGRKGTAGAQRPGVPSPPKRRRPALTALALLAGASALEAQETRRYVDARTAADTAALPFSGGVLASRTTSMPLGMVTTAP